ncbi:hypothetical protein ACN38_g2496 [Penicillium nordicum]|uniref:Uncharacterized protein n=1 Tax=Penicillium nordicum TaxID=229535 RepID=A0A0M8PEL2_9EURO|nr:hypothetical protein ACN38_g2496 [Penicillium nordicum]
MLPLVGEWRGLHATRSYHIWPSLPPRRQQGAGVAIRFIFPYARTSKVINWTGKYHLLIASRGMYHYQF